MSRAAKAERRRARPGARRGVGLLRTGAIAIGGATLLWLTVAVTLAMTLADPRPFLVLSLWPAAAIAGADTAVGLISPPLSPAQAKANADRAQALAGAALTREPVLAGAASALGAAAALAGNEARADAAFADAQHLSRRDLQSQLWSIERTVKRGDVAGALTHYDIALRANPPTVVAPLLPVLARASASAAVRGPLIAMLRRRPSWRLPYLQTMLAAGLPPEAVAEQLAGAHLDLHDPGQAALLSVGLGRLVEARQYRLAAAMLPGPQDGLRNGSFEQEPTLLPFDWSLATDEDLSAYREPEAIGEGAYVLRLASKDRGGVLARQLVMLRAGRWVLSGLVGGSAPAITVMCEGQDGQALAALPPSASAAGTRRFALAFTVPSGCEAQSITVATPAGSSIVAWIDALRLRQIDQRDRLRKNTNMGSAANTR